MSLNNLDLNEHGRRGKCPRAPVVDLPHGYHIVRMLADPESRLFDFIYLHQSGDDRTVCRGPDCELCNIAEINSHLMRKLKREYDYRLNPKAKRKWIFYMQVIESNVSEDNWQRDKIYAVTTNDRVGKQILRYICDLVQAVPDSGYLLDPDRTARCFEIRYEGGLQGAVNVSLHPFRESGPIEAGENRYLPLVEVWRVPDTEESYRRLFVAATTVQMRLQLG